MFIEEIVTHPMGESVPSHGVQQVCELFNENLRLKLELCHQLG